MTNTDALREKIKESGLKMQYIADNLDLSIYGLSLKISNRNEFKASEIACLCELLNITSLKEKDALFFASDIDLKSN